MENLFDTRFLDDLEREIAEQIRVMRIEPVRLKDRQDAVNRASSWVERLLIKFPVLRKQDQSNESTATEARLRVPFDGHAEVFRCKPQTRSVPTPRAELMEGAIVIVVSAERSEGANDAAIKMRSAKSKVLETLEDIEIHLKRLQGETFHLNSRIRAAARKRFVEMLEENEAHDAALEEAKKPF